MVSTKGKIAIAAGAIFTGIVVILIATRKKSSGQGGDGSLANFVYSESYAWAGDAFNGWYPINYQIKVTNPNDSLVSKVVTVLATQYYQGVLIGTPGTGYGSQVMTISANSSQLFVPSLGFSGGNGFTWDIFVRDADGAESPHLQI
jgi:hypothetical protein